LQQFLGQFIYFPAGIRASAYGVSTRSKLSKGLTNMKAYRNPVIHSLEILLIILFVEYCFPLRLLFAQDMNLTGQWMLVDSKGTIDCPMLLEQKNGEIRGACQYNNGSTRITGKISGNSLTLVLIDENPDVIARWLPKSIAAQVVGILSVATFPNIQGQKELKGIYAGWHVRWTPDGRVAVKANGGSKEALAANISRPIALRRVVMPGASQESAVGQQIPAALQGVEVYRIMTSSSHPSESPQGVSDTFSLDKNHIYCFFKLRGVKAGSAISSVWYFLGIDSPAKIAEITVISKGGDSAQFEVMRDSNCNEEAKRMPPGKYRIDILIDGKKEAQTYFRVQ
jgi:hypothetical protein